jgi:hypothetical protein
MPARTLWTKGEARFAPNGQRIPGLAKVSYCSIHFEGNFEKDFPSGLNSALAILRPHQVFLDELVASGAELTFFVGWFSDWNSRDVTGWNIMKTLGEMKISLDLDFYGPDVDSVTAEEPRAVPVPPREV